MKRTITSILLTVILLSALHSLVGVTEYVMEYGVGITAQTETIDSAEALPVSDFALNATSTSVPPSVSLILRNVSTAFLLASLSVAILLSFYGVAEIKALVCLRSTDESRRLLPYHGFV